jgi:hypothetical protein
VLSGIGTLGATLFVRLITIALGHQSLSLPGAHSY